MDDLNEKKEDLTLESQVRAALDTGPLPAKLLAAIHGMAEREWKEKKIRRSRFRLRFLNAISTIAAAVVICTFSFTQYLETQKQIRRDSSIENLNRLIDLVSLSYPEETSSVDMFEDIAIITEDDYFAEFNAEESGISDGKLSPIDSVVARLDSVIVGN